MPRKTLDEQIEITEKKAAIEKARLRELKARKRSLEKKQAEKARVHRLIQIGAICEEVYGAEITEGILQDALRQFLRDQDSRGGYFSGYLNKAKEKAAPETANVDGAAENNQ